MHISISRYLLVFVFILFSSCNGKESVRKVSDNSADPDKVMDSWHMAAARANAEVFFGLMDSSFVYLGTDATERWNKEEFYSFARPYFDKGKAWDFKPYNRQIHYSASKNTAWFDELLDTWMGVCRGSGVMVFKDNEWKLTHYHLSVTIDNDLMDGFLELTNPPEFKSLKK